MKTAMQELKDEISQVFHDNQIPLKIDITKYLEKEKEQLLKEYHRGMVDEFNIILNVAKPKPLTKTNK